MAKVALHFDTDIAREIDTNSAIILQNIEFWQLKNKSNNQNFYDDRYWVYNSIKAWCELFDFLSEKQIRTCLSKLEKADKIVTGNYNKMKSDRTKWYSSTRIDHLVICNLPNGNLDLPISANGFAQEGEPLPVNKPIIKPVINNSETKVSQDLFLSEENSQVNNSTEEKKKVATKKKKNREDFNSDIIEFTAQLFKLFPKTTTEKLKEAQKVNWIDTVDKLIRLDDFSKDEIENAVKSAFSDKFWGNNFQSLTKLRKPNKDGVMYASVFLSLDSPHMRNIGTGGGNYENHKTTESDLI